MNRAPLTFQLNVTVRSYEVEPAGHATELTLQNYLQEAAATHAHRLYFSIQRLFPMGLTWLLIKSRLRVDRYPLWQEQVVVETWPSGWKGAVAWRDIHFKDREGATLARATTHWMLFDFRKKRPASIETHFKALPALDRQIIDRDIPNLAAPSRVDFHQTLTAGWLNMDMNNHANNAAYIYWAMVPMPADFRRKWVVHQLDINYLKEVFPGTLLTCRVHLDEEEGKMRSLHEIVNEKDHPVMRARVHWRPRKREEYYTVVEERDHGRSSVEG